VLYKFSTYLLTYLHGSITKTAVSPTVTFITVGSPPFGWNKLYCLWNICKSLVTHKSDATKLTHSIKTYEGYFFYFTIFTVCQTVAAKNGYSFMTSLYFTVSRTSVYNAWYQLSTCSTCLLIIQTTLNKSSAHTT